MIAFICGIVGVVGVFCFRECSFVSVFVRVWCVRGVFLLVCGLSIDDLFSGACSFVDVAVVLFQVLEVCSVCVVFCLFCRALYLVFRARERAHGCGSASMRECEHEHERVGE